MLYKYIYTYIQYTYIYENLFKVKLQEQETIKNREQRFEQNFNAFFHHLPLYAMYVIKR